ncbi:MAG: DUF488 domain-containing protein [Desulfobulbaceae bacterium]|nr:DUF488 domain-containing protein [Desulfobulbaceae bacterium]HIJ79160.1 DUF488 domain-containing protein [Deltaproteobacteria bacterium]
MNATSCRPQREVYTIGHSNHSVTAFCDLLAGHDLQIVVDVRSSPFSKHVPQFNKKEIAPALTGQNRQYLFMGDLVGGKPADPKWYDERAKVRYDLLAQSTSFQQGIERILKGVDQGYRIVLMCAEENPLQCHRHLLIARTLEQEKKTAVLHLRGDGALLRARDFLASAEQLKLF